MRWAALIKKYATLGASSATVVTANAALTLFLLNTFHFIDRGRDHPTNFALVIAVIFGVEVIGLWFVIHLATSRRQAKENELLKRLRRARRDLVRDQYNLLDLEQKLSPDQYLRDGEKQHRARETTLRIVALRREGDEIQNRLDTLEQRVLELSERRLAIPGHWASRTDGSDADPLILLTEEKDECLKHLRSFWQAEYSLTQEIRGPGKLGRVPPIPKGAKELQEVLFATNRVVRQEEIFDEKAITDERGTGQLYGRAWVSIPGRHRIGTVDAPKFDWLKLRVEDERADKHFLLLDLSRMTNREFFADLASSSHDCVLVFVHGYNTSFREAVFKAAQIAFDTNFAGRVVAFSWPSGNSVARYDYDRESALSSASSLLTILRDMKTSGDMQNLFIVAHSLGSQVVVDALQIASLSNIDLNLRELVFAAPDVDRDVFKSRTDSIHKVAGGVTIYASSADKALIISKAKAGGVPRAGDMPLIGPLLLPGIDLIDVTVLGEDMFALNHGTFASARSALDDLGRLVTSRIRPPHVRTPTLQRMPDRRQTLYWMYPP